MNRATGNVSSWRPTPPQRGAFPLDHDNECQTFIQEYLNCLKLVKGNNAPSCRLLAKNYLKCRMDNGLMDEDSWENLGLPDEECRQLRSETALESKTGSKSETKSKN